MNNKKRELYTNISYFTYFSSHKLSHNTFLNKMALNLISIIGLSLLFTIVIMRFKNCKETEEIIKYVSNINKLDFSIPEDAGLSEEAKG